MMHSTRLLDRDHCSTENQQEQHMSSVCTQHELRPMHRYEKRVSLASHATRNGRSRWILNVASATSRWPSGIRSSSRPCSLLNPAPSATRGVTTTLSATSTTGGNRRPSSSVQSAESYLDDAAIAGCRPSVNSSIILELKAGMSSGLRLVTSPLSTTTSSSTQLPPAFFTSV